MIHQSSRSRVRLAIALAVVSLCAACMGDPAAPPEASVQPVVHVTSPPIAVQEYADSTITCCITPIPCNVWVECGRPAILTTAILSARTMVCCFAPDGSITCIDLVPKCPAPNEHWQSAIKKPSFTLAELR